MLGIVQLIKKYGTADERRQAGAVLRFLDSVEGNGSAYRNPMDPRDPETGQSALELAGYCETLGLVEKCRREPYGMRLTEAGRAVRAKAQKADALPSTLAPDQLIEYGFERRPNGNANGRIAPYFVAVTAAQRQEHGGARWCNAERKPLKPLTDYLFALWPGNGTCLFGVYDINGEGNSVGTGSKTDEAAQSKRRRLAGMFGLKEEAFGIYNAELQQMK